jgi:hypothetical protein
VVQIRRRLESGGVKFLVVLQPDGSFAFMPAWMIEPAASRFEIGDEPHFPLDILRSMRAEVDALLGFLRSESKPEQVHDDARIRESPAKPVRRGEPRIDLRPAQRVELAGLVEALLREIAASLASVASDESGDEQDHG